MAQSRSGNSTPTPYSHPRFSQLKRESLLPQTRRLRLSSIRSRDLKKGSSSGKTLSFLVNRRIPRDLLQFLILAKSVLHHPGSTFTSSRAFSLHKNRVSMQCHAFFFYHMIEGF
ncbi:hypothetical protein CEXT_608081 [Caerostris extrusa]|uniref:Uncharacterized protein n=1 Tax=Caerostris extrusa TaxID=172846 RepID=A0AAV4NCA9_CAEEX|nr:hypothetical protein CEXT_608081 [Caerostris extrusa]